MIHLKRMGLGLLIIGLLILLIWLIEDYMAQSIACIFVMLVVIMAYSLGEMFLDIIE